MNYNNTGDNSGDDNVQFGFDSSKGVASFGSQ